MFYGNLKKKKQKKKTHFQQAKESYDYFPSEEKRGRGRGGLCVNDYLGVRVILLLGYTLCNLLRMRSSQRGR